MSQRQGGAECDTRLADAGNCGPKCGTRHKRTAPTSWSICRWGQKPSRGPTSDCLEFPAGPRFTPRETRREAYLLSNVSQQCEILSFASHAACEPRDRSQRYSISLSRIEHRFNTD